jgi:hypothetical protein
MVAISIHFSVVVGSETGCSAARSARIVGI